MTNNKKPINVILQSDAYKMTHWKLYPEDTQYIYSYLESRGGRFNETLFYGLQGFIKNYLEGPIIEQWMVDEAREHLSGVFGQDYFNAEGWQHIVDHHGGKLPLSITAVPEGTVIPTRNVLATITNTDPKLPWLVGWAETLFMQLWYPITVATLSYQIKKLIARYCVETGSGISPFHLNDFGFRGVSSRESAAIGGSAHLVNFLGTDTLAGIEYANQFYDAGVCGHSVMASEHSTTTLFEREGEEDAYRHFLKTAPRDAILSIVADSYNIYHAVDVLMGQNLYSEIMNRTGKTVIRPDSGDPPTMCVRVLQMLENRFGITTNPKGFKVLPPQVGVIYGDGINYDSIDDICRAVMAAGFSMENVVFGMGGALLQQVNRDTHKFAFKASAAVVGDRIIDVFKQPITDPGKDSKKGYLALVRNEDGIYSTVRNDELGDRKNLLREIFRNGDLLINENFASIRDRVK